MIFKTPFGTIEDDLIDDTERLHAVVRALNWCETILQGSEWRLGPADGEGQISIRRTVNENLVELFPLEGARLDLGLDASFPIHHLPVSLNGERVCVRSRSSSHHPLHTDMVASMMMLFGFEEFTVEAVPKTLHDLLTEDQLASLLQHQRRRRTRPGQPSTSGRAFLNEATVLECLAENWDQPFEGQFERRDGTLRTIRAQIVDWEFGGEGWEGTENPWPLMSYNPRDYNLIVVTDMDLGQYRLVATDRMTSLTVGGRLMETESAE